MLEFALSFCLSILGLVVPEKPTPHILYCGDVGTLAKMVKGRALLLMLHKGMTQEEVVAVLGPAEFRTSFGCWGPSLDYWQYVPSGLVLTFDANQRSDDFWGYSGGDGR